MEYGFSHMVGMPRGFSWLALHYSTINVLTLRGEEDCLIIRLRHVGGDPIRGSITVDTDYELGGGKRLGGVEPVNFTIDGGKEEDVRVKMNSRLVEEEMYKITITSENLMFKKIVHHCFIRNP